MHSTLLTKRALKLLLFRHLLITFIFLGVLGALIINLKSEQSIKDVQQQGIQVELEGIKHHIQHQLQSWQGISQQIIQHPTIQKSLNHDRQILQSDLTKLTAVISTPIAIFDQGLNRIYGNMTTYDQYKRIRLHAAQMVRSGQQHPWFKLYLDKGSYVLRLYSPIIKQKMITGILVTELPLDLGLITPADSDDILRWIGLSQSNEMQPTFPPLNSNWQRYQLPLDYSDLILHFGVNTQQLEAQQNTGFYQISLGLLLILLLVLFISYRMGQTILIPPYHELMTRQKMLSSSYEELQNQLSVAKELAKVAKYAHDAVIITNPQGEVTWANDASEKITGYPLDELMGKSPGALLHGPDTSQITRHKMGVAIRQKRSIRCEVLNYTREGKSYWVDINITPVFNDSGELKNFFAIKRDSTKQHQLQESLKKALERAEAASVAKTRFLANVSHEIRTPMNGILGMAQLLRSTQLHDDQTNYLDNLQSSGQHLMALLNDILDYSKSETDGLRLNPEHFQLKDLIQGIHNTYRAIAHEKGIYFILDNQTSPDSWLFADKERINQILLNLITNAIKFTPSGFVKVGLYEEISGSLISLTLLVEDSGIGIAPENQNTIFAPFTQAEESTTRRFGGTGLGLAIVQQIAQAMGGKISLHSQLEQGSTFTVRLPVPAGEEQITDRTTITTRFHTDHLKALVVEDDRTNALILERFLIQRGFDCESVANGRMAIEATQKNFFPLIMMDNHMPELDGIKATQIIREQSESDPLIIGCTADVHTESHEEMLKAGADIVLSKPLEEIDLDKVLHNHASHFNFWIRRQQPTLNRDTPLTKMNKLSDNSSSDSQQADPPLPDAKADVYTEPCSTFNDRSGAMDINQLSMRLGDDSQLVCEFLSLFIQEQKETGNKLHKAISANELEQVVLISHSIKGVAANIGASALREAALTIEKKARKGSLPAPKERDELIRLLEQALQEAAGERDRLME